MNLTLEYPVVIAIALVVAGCDGPTNSSATSDTSGIPDVVGEQMSPAPELFDLGRVDLRDGPVRREHRFQISNHSRLPLEITGVKATCGCIECEVDQYRIESGASTSLNIAFEILSPGQITHGARVVFSNGTVAEYMLTAYGELGIELIAIRQSACLRADAPIHALRLYRVDSDGQIQRTQPKVIEPADVNARIGEWKLIEDGLGGVRPARQIIDVELDFSGYIGEFPVQVIMGTEGGERTNFTVYPPSGLPPT